MLIADHLEGYVLQKKLKFDRTEKFATNDYRDIAVFFDNYAGLRD